MALLFAKLFRILAAFIAAWVLASLICYDLGVAHMERGEYTQAITFYDRAIKLAPEYADAYSWRGYAYAALGEFDLAIQDVEQYLELEPDSEYREELLRMIEAWKARGPETLDGKMRG
jgi:tetratricopeptide (TPR) repeat protein